MTPEELTGRLSNQKIVCDHNMKARQPGLCKKCKEEFNPYMVFLMCPTDECDHSGERCGWFWGSGNSNHCGQRAQWTIKVDLNRLYTDESVRASLAPKWDTYYAKLTLGQPPTWNCDQRTKDSFCLQQWLMEELMALQCPDEDRRFVLNFYNRKARAENDLYALAATAMNSVLTNTIERYRGR